MDFRKIGLILPLLLVFSKLRKKNNWQVQKKRKKHKQELLSN